MIINDIDKFIHLALSLSFTVTNNISLQNITITIATYSHTPYMYLIHWLLTGFICNTEQYNFH